jgi:hypothetical protein
MLGEVLYTSRYFENRLFVRVIGQLQSVARQSQVVHVDVVVMLTALLAVDQLKNCELASKPLLKLDSPLCVAWMREDPKNGQAVELLKLQSCLELSGIGEVDFEGNVRCSVRTLCHLLNGQAKCFELLTSVDILKELDNLTLCDLDLSIRDEQAER